MSLRIWGILLCLTSCALSLRIPKEMVNLPYIDGVTNNDGYYQNGQFIGDDAVMKALPSYLELNPHQGGYYINNLPEYEIIQESKRSPLEIYKRDECSSFHPHNKPIFLEHSPNKSSYLVCVDRLSAVAMPCALGTRYNHQSQSCDTFDFSTMFYQAGSPLSNISDGELVPGSSTKTTTSAEGPGELDPTPTSESTTNPMLRSRKTNLGYIFGTGADVPINDYLPFTDSSLSRPYKVKTLTRVNKELGHAISTSNNQKRESLEIHSREDCKKFPGNSDRPMLMSHPFANDKYLVCINQMSAVAMRCAPGTIYDGYIQECSQFAAGYGTRVGEIAADLNLDEQWQVTDKRLMVRDFKIPDNEYTATKNVATSEESQETFENASAAVNEETSSNATENASTSSSEETYTTTPEETLSTVHDETDSTSVQEGSSQPSDGTTMTSENIGYSSEIASELHTNIENNVTSEIEVATEGTSAEIKATTETQKMTDIDDDVTQNATFIMQESFDSSLKRNASSVYTSIQAENGTDAREVLTEKSSYPEDRTSISDTASEPDNATGDEASKSPERLTTTIKYFTAKWVDSDEASFPFNHEISDEVINDTSEQKISLGSRMNTWQLREDDAIEESIHNTSTTEQMPILTTEEFEIDTETDAISDNQTTPEISNAAIDALSGFKFIAPQINDEYNTIKIDTIEVESERMKETTETEATTEEINETNMATELKSMIDQFETTLAITRGRGDDTHVNSTISNQPDNEATTADVQTQPVYEKTTTDNSTTKTQVEDSDNQDDETTSEEATTTSATSTLTTGSEAGNNQEQTIATTMTTEENDLGLSEDTFPTEQTEMKLLENRKLGTSMEDYASQNNNNVRVENLKGEIVTTTKALLYTSSPRTPQKTLN